ncbi:MAG TPA: hypothetical protein VIL09_15040 [Microvirga sp.]|jgi:hypothetical protein
MTAVFVAGVASAHAAPLTGDEIKQQLAGKELKLKNGRVTGTVTYNADGTAKLSLPALKVSDTGVWTTKGNQICVTWKAEREGKETCATVETVRSKVYRTGTGVELTAP